jgi:hypothetical protein
MAKGEVTMSDPDRTNTRNEAAARTAFHDETGTWYGLDNAASIMPAVSDTVSTSLFRIQFTLDHGVDEEALRASLAATVRRYPYFAVELRRGLFWYYFEHHRGALGIDPDRGSPCQDYDIRRRGNALFRIRAKGSTLSGEFSHALTDGSGGLRFMQTLLVEYFRRRGIPPGIEPGTGEFADIPAIGEEPHPGEYEDAYNRYFTEDLPPPDPGVPAWHLTSPRLRRHEYRIISGSIPLGSALAAARERGVSLTEFLAAVYLDALQEIWVSSSGRSRSRWHLGLEIPVNMRSYYPTRSNRNFSLFVIVSQDMRLGKRDFAEVVARTHHQMRIENDVRSIARQITRNVGGSRILAVRLVPLFVKDFFAHILFSKLGENLVTGFLSNLGRIRMPPGPAGHIVRVDFIPTPSAITLANAGVASWGDELRIDFGSLAVSRDLEMHFFRRLRSLDLPVRIDCTPEGGS